MSNPSMPWSVKGIPDDVRALAKKQAQQSGMTIGAWLSNVIRDQEQAALAEEQQGGLSETDPDFESALASLKLHSVEDLVSLQTQAQAMQSVMAQAGGAPAQETDLSQQTTGATQAVVEPKLPKGFEELPQLVLILAERLANLENDTIEFAASFQDQLSDMRRQMTKMSHAARHKAPHDPVDPA